jgi:hypothetical protein
MSYDKCPINKTIIAQEIRNEEKKLIESNNNKISGSPCPNIKNLYIDSGRIQFRGIPYRWSPNQANHVWFFPKKKSILNI